MDAGSKTFSSDGGAHGAAAADGFAVGWPLERFGAAGQVRMLVRLSEEHGFIPPPWSGICPWEPACGFIPNHACPVVNLTDRLVVRDGDGVQVPGRWTPGAGHADAFKYARIVMNLNLKRNADIDDADGPPARPAATLVILRDGAAGLEVLLLRRSRELSAFAGGLGFPRRSGGTGGRPGRRLAGLSDHCPPCGRPGIGRRDRTDRGNRGRGAPVAMDRTRGDAPAVRYLVLPGGLARDAGAHRPG